MHISDILDIFSMDKNLNNIFVISSPSGGGKSSLIEALLSDERAEKIKLSVSFTTREIRSSEKNQKDYIFIKEDEFMKKIDDGDFIEYAKVFGNFYGTDKLLTEKILKSKDILLELDWQGAFSLKKTFKNVISVFLITPSYKDLEKRLSTRGTESDRSMNLRLSAAKDEISKYKSYDYLILNDNFESALKDFKTIIFEKKSPSEFKTRVTSDLLRKLLD